MPGKHGGRPPIFRGPTKTVTVTLPWPLFERAQELCESPEWQQAYLQATLSEYMRAATTVLNELLQGPTKQRVIEFVKTAYSEYLEKGRITNPEGSPLQLGAHLAFRWGMEARAIENGWQPPPPDEAPLDDAAPWTRLPR